MIRFLHYLYSNITKNLNNSSYAWRFFLVLLLGLNSFSGFAQNEAGTDAWIGHVYDNMDFTNYKGTIEETEEFDESFPIPFQTLEGASVTASTFSVRFRMNSTRRAICIVDIGSDDGSRLFVDNVAVFDDWYDHAFFYRRDQLINLNGSSELVLEYYERWGGNRVAFRNLEVLIDNQIYGDCTYNGLIVRGRGYQDLPAGFQKVGTGFQWAYSTSSDGTGLTDIPGATEQNYSPDFTQAPFNSGATYYFYRKVTMTKSSPNRRVTYPSGNIVNISNAVEGYSGICCSTGLDSDGDGIADLCDKDDDNDGILDMDEQSLTDCTHTVAGDSSMFDFETATIGKKIPKWYVQNISGLGELIYAHNKHSQYNSYSDVGAIEQSAGPDGTLTKLINVNAGTLTSSGHMSSFTPITNVDLTHEIIVAYGDFKLNGNSTGNEAGISIGQNERDPIWSDDDPSGPDAVFAYTFGRILVREPNSSPYDFNWDRSAGWYHQEVTFYVENGNLKLINKVWKYDAAGNLTNPENSGVLDLGAISQYSWINDASIYFSADYIVDNIGRKIIYCDTDEDDVPNYLDLDSDNDGCVDAMDGGSNDSSDPITEDDLVSANVLLSVGNGSSANSENLCAASACIDADGVPSSVSGSQSVGDSKTAGQLSITTQPTDLTICENDNAAFTAVPGNARITTSFNADHTPNFSAGTTEDVNYQWMVYNSITSSWEDIAGESGTVSGGTAVTLNLGVQNDFTNDGKKYRLKLTSANMPCPFYSDEVTLVVSDVSNNINSSNGFKGGNICKNGQGVLTFNAVNDGLFPYTIKYRDEDNGTIHTQVISSDAAESFNVATNPTTVGTHTYTLLSIENKNGCERTSGFGRTTAKIIIREDPALVISMSVNQQVACQGGASPSITCHNSDPKEVKVTYNINGGSNLTINVNGNSSTTLSVPTSSTGLFIYTATSVEYVSAPNCASNINMSKCFVIFPENTTAPTVNGGFGPIVVTEPPAVSGFVVEYSFDDGVTWGANTPPTADNCSGYKIKTRYRFTGTCAGISTTACATSNATTRIVDNTDPVFTTPADQAFCVNHITQASFVNTTDGDVNNPPDYYEFSNGETVLDLTNITDNCCTTGNTISWAITPQSNGVSISGTGQPSASIGGKRLWLDISSTNPKSSYTEKIYTITYTVTDCHNNSTTETKTITIKPRPKILN